MHNVCFWQAGLLIKLVVICIIVDRFAAKILADSVNAKMGQERPTSRVSSRMKCPSE